jgi:transposase, IS5 family
MFKQRREKGLFDEELRLSKLSKQNDPLLKLDQFIDWEFFRTILETNLKVIPKNKGGRKPYDYILQFKMLILQRYYGLSDDQIEFQVLDRLTFMRFLGITLADDVPDSKTVWNFKETLTEKGLVKQLFDIFNQQLSQKGIILNEGRIVDASFVEVPRQRNTKEENALIKADKTPEAWKDEPNKLRQKDVDARWVKKNDVNYYGYKDHVKCDSKSKIILKYDVTDASVHDSQAMDDLIDTSDNGQPLWADSAYAGQPIKKILKKNNVKNRIHKKAAKNKPLTTRQKNTNKEKSKVRARVEHIFGFIENSMKGSYIRTIGIVRAKTTIGLMNLTYNLCRFTQIQAMRGIAVS